MHACMLVQQDYKGNSTSSSKELKQKDSDFLQNICSPYRIYVLYLPKYSYGETLVKWFEW